MLKISLQALSLKNYRNFDNLDLRFGDKLVFIIGENGSGKTNILESISLLSPGRGIRFARFEEIIKNGCSSWHSKFTLQSKLGLAEITNNFTLHTSRTLAYNGSKISSNELTKLTSIIWLTPQMEGIFLDTSSERRRFLDRIVYSFDPLHARRINKYEHYQSQRLRALVQENGCSDLWLKGIEESMSKSAEEIDQKRREIINIMQSSIDNLHTAFPRAQLAITNLLLEPKDTSSDFVGYYSDKLKDYRQKDKYSGKTNFGVHKTDFIVSYKDKNQLAKYCSTGEQKAMLISIMLSQIDCLKNNARIMPILLLDEIFVHLDERRKDYLLDYIIDSQMQSFITATETGSMANKVKNMQLIEI